MKINNPKLKLKFGAIALTPDLYYEVMEILDNYAFQFSKGCSYSKDDLLAESNIHKAYLSFKPNKGMQHSVWMIKIGIQNMKRFIKVRSKKDAVHVLMGNDIPDIHGESNRELERAMFLEELELLEPSAKKVVVIIFKMPRGVVEGEKPKKIRGQLRNSLKEEGWSDRQINESFAKIRQFVLRTK